ncbi:formylglycine-generating enzyme family protein [Streptomyces griseorubiginosus]|uniref:formylglycine-generating enzyme family protein n=1 Tax=Streptomyces griseorubiginosus TaxID=67304 RepID=UPI003456BFE8
MMLRTALVNLGMPPNLPPLVDEEHNVALQRLKYCLQTEYEARVAMFGSSHTATPKLLLERLSDVADSHIGSSDVVLLVLRSYVTVFERQGVRFCAVSLRDSTPGRPSSMVPTSELLGQLSSIAGDAPVLAFLDLDLLPSSSRYTTPAPHDVAALLRDNAAASLRHRASCLVRVQAMRSMAKRAPMAQALERILQSTADGGTAVTGADVIDRSYSYLSSGGLSAIAMHKARQAGTFVPRNRDQRLPEYLREDLYSPDPGSRLDAVVDLADLMRGNNDYARRCIEDLQENDRSAEVRTFAFAASRSQRIPDISRLADFGFLSAAAVRESSAPVIPPLTDWLDGLGVMGVDAPMGQSFERPAHRVNVPAFRMALRPTTNADYLAYVLATGAEPPGHWRSGWVFTEDLHHPVVMVSWYEARQYCRWLTEQARIAGLLDESQVIALPSEAEWEIAARNGGSETHPWGNYFDPDHCNVRATGLGKVVRPGSFSPAGDSSAGCVDLIGNVWEWTTSAWGRSGRHPHFNYPYNADDGREDPDSTGDVRRVVRGGGYYYADVCANSFTRNRVAPSDRHPAGGFRVTVRREK